MFTRSAWSTSCRANNLERSTSVGFDGLPCDEGASSSLGESVIFYLGMVIALTTQALIKEHAGISGTSADDVIATIATGVNEAVESHLGRDLEDDGNDATEYYDGSGTNMLQLRKFPVFSVTSINVDLDRDFNAATLVDSGDYVIYKPTGIVKFKPVSSPGLQAIPKFLSGFQNVEVKYRAGYKTSSPISTAVPDGLKLAATMWAVEIFNKRREHGMFSTTRGAATEMFDIRHAGKHIIFALSRYRSGAIQLAGWST
jgi:hypothetical protein